nr:SdpI family protein [Paenibacillus sediminis]
MSFLIGTIFFLSGIILKKKSPKEINGFYGYRTIRSMKNKQLWEAGNKYSAQLMSMYGIFLFIIGVIISLLIKGIVTTFVIIGLMIFFIVIMFVKVEQKLKSLEQESSNCNII